MNKLPNLLNSVNIIFAQFCIFITTIAVRFLPGKAPDSAFGIASMVRFVVRDRYDDGHSDLCELRHSFCYCCVIVVNIGVNCELSEGRLPVTCELFGCAEIKGIAVGVF